MTTETDSNTAEGQAVAQLDSIRAMLDRLAHANDCNGDDCSEGMEEGDGGVEAYHDEDSASQDIDEDPLSVLVRSDWHDVGGESEDAEYEILLCTGGPACRIRGTLSMAGEPDRARIEYQDWGTPWTELILDSDGYKTLVAYAQHFYFGD